MFFSVYLEVMFQSFEYSADLVELIIVDLPLLEDRISVVKLSQCFLFYRENISASIVKDKEGL